MGFFCETWHFGVHCGAGSNPAGAYEKQREMTTLPPTQWAPKAPLRIVVTGAAGAETAEARQRRAKEKRKKKKCHLGLRKPGVVAEMVSPCGYHRRLTLPIAEMVSLLGYQRRLTLPI